MISIDINNNQIQDIGPLSNLKRLTYIDLVGNPIPQYQIDWLHQQLPDCEINFGL